MNFYWLDNLGLYIMKKTVKLIIFGMLTWLIPFIVSCLFYSKNNHLLINPFLFKSIMIVVGAAVGALFLVLYFRGLSRNFVYQGFIVGFAWLVLNWFLDFVILIPLSHMAISTYFMQIGIRYLIIPIFSVSMGFVAKNN